MSTNETMASQLTDVPEEESVAIEFEEEILSNPFEEEFEAEEALENIEANDAIDQAITGVSSINIEMIPQEMTPREVVAHFQSTGTFIIPSTDGVVLNPQPVAIPEEHPVAVETESRLKKRATARAKLEAELLIEREKAEKKFNDIAKRKKRKSMLHHTSYTLQSNDLMLLLNGQGHVEMIKSDIQRTGKITKLQQDLSDYCKHTGARIPLLNNGLLFDKNMNPLTINGATYNEKSMKGFSRIDVRDTSMGSYISPATKKRWIIVDKKAFVASNGKKFKVKHRVGFSILETLKVKRKILSQIEEAETFIERVKEAVSGIYDEEHYEIIYHLNFRGDSATSNFYIYLQFPDLTVNNSIEMTHTIENMMTRMNGTHYKGNHVKENSFRIVKRLYGMRTKFTPEDAYYKYNHSHLSTNSQGWNGFCMGDDHFMAGLDSMYGYLSFIELEMLLIGVLDHISWESLEGGPYIKMEDIGGKEGMVINIDGFHRSLNVHSRITIDRIFRSIKSKDLTPLKKAFTLKMQSNKEVTYVLNKPMFIEQFSKLISSDIIRSINHDFELSEYMYIPSEQHFVTNRGGSVRAKDWKTLVKTARTRIGKFPIVYMNGKYIRPQVINTDNPSTVTKREILTFHPKILFYVANVIHYHLLNELKNVK